MMFWAASSATSPSTMSNSACELHVRACAGTCDLWHAPSVGTPVNTNPKKPFARTGDRLPSMVADGSSVRIHLGVCGAPRL